MDIAVSILLTMWLHDRLVGDVSELQRSGWTDPCAIIVTAGQGQDHIVLVRDRYRYTQNHGFCPCY